MTDGPTGPDFIELGKGSSGWEHIFKRFNTLNPRKLNPIFKKARTGIDLGSSVGHSAYALLKLCPYIDVIHCVDDTQPLEGDLKNALGTKADEHRMLMEEFLALPDTPEVDIVMISSLKGQPFFERKNLANLAAKVKKAGILLIYNPDYSFEFNQDPLTKYFNKLAGEARSGEVWQKK